MFDSDEDGLLSREELARATQMLHTIEMENAEEDVAVELKGEVRSEPPPPAEEEVEDRRRLDEAQTEVVHTDAVLCRVFLDITCFISA